MKTVVHVTHEAVQKIGGIGAVLQGLITSKVYRGGVRRDILLGPLFYPEGPAEQRLGGGEVLYSGLDGVRKSEYAGEFERIEREFGVKIVYGRKRFSEPLTAVSSEAEVLLIDVRNYNAARLGVLKFKLYQDYGIESSRHEHIWDYEQYCRIAEPGLEAVRAIGACGEGAVPIVLSHEYMGMPTALTARSLFPGQFRTIFYAHEVATVRRIVEEHPGHDTMFYNVLAKAAGGGEFVEDVFGSQRDFHKHPLVAASRHCDNILAVGDYVVKELRFLQKEFARVPIDLAYNGVPAPGTTLDAKMASRKKLQHYCRNLLGFEPNFVFTHMTRLVPSKGLWRDVRVVEHLERHLAKAGETSVLFVVSTERAGRSAHEVLAMEQNYGWPVAHREGPPDLSGGEAEFYAGVQAWNARGRSAKIVFINQFVMDAASLGGRAPAEIDFLDFRRGSDVEFGQSIYEPFGIAQVEPIGFGGICVFTEVCGCAGFVRKAHAATGGKEKNCPNAIEVDYTRLPEGLRGSSIQELIAMDAAVRIGVEEKVAATAAAELFERLPRKSADFARLLASGQQMAREMSWDAVARNYVLPGMDRAMSGSGATEAT